MLHIIEVPFKIRNDIIAQCFIYLVGHAVMELCKGLFAIVLLYPGTSDEKYFLISQSV